jgi:hypothetical protein
MLPDCPQYNIVRGKNLYRPLTNRVMNEGPDDDMIDVFVTADGYMLLASAWVAVRLSEW